LHSACAATGQRELPGAETLEEAPEVHAGRSPAAKRTSGFCKIARELVMLRRNKLLNNKEARLP
jgi:hypothetical protein